MEETVIRNNLDLYDYVKNIQKRNICYNLKNVDENIVKNVKSLYQIYNLLYQTQKVIIRNVDDDYKKSINDFYSYLRFNINFIKEEIYKFIMLIQDDEFDNDKVLENRIKYYSEHKNIDETLYNE